MRTLPKTRTFARLMSALALAFTFALPASGASAQTATAQGCRPGQAPAYVFGFAELHIRRAGSMGDALSCEFPDPNGTGDVHQRTARGLAFWRKSTNTPTFTNGSEHWASTTRGFLYWTGTSIDPPADATVVPPNPCVGCASVDPEPPTPRGPSRDELPPNGPATFIMPVIEPPANDTIFACIQENPSCGRDLWWAERNELRKSDLRQYRFLAPNFVTEHRYVEEIWLLWQWPEGKTLLQDAARFGVDIATGPVDSAMNFASFDSSTRTVWVNGRYADSATWLVADILAHELTHASDAAARRLGFRPSDCIAAEQRAFRAELRFLTYIEGRLGLPTTQNMSRQPMSDRAIYSDAMRTLRTTTLDADVSKLYEKTCAA